MKTPDCGCTEHFDGRLSRRHLVAATALTGAAVLGSGSLVSASTPVAEGTIDLDRVMALSSRLAGGASLDASAGEGLVSLLAAEPGIDATLRELEGVENFTPETLTETLLEAQRIATNILQYWFLGQYNGIPTDNRAERFFGLACWQTLPYFTQPTMCKSFGYWAEDLESQLY